MGPFSGVNKCGCPATKPPPYVSTRNWSEFAFPERQSSVLHKGQVTHQVRKKGDVVAARKNQATGKLPHYIPRSILIFPPLPGTKRASPPTRAFYTKTSPRQSSRGVEGCRSGHRCIERAITLLLYTTSEQLSSGVPPVPLCNRSKRSIHHGWRGVLSRVSRAIPRSDGLSYPPPARSGVFSKLS